MALVIFDMDGTLIDSSVAIEKTINFMRDRVGLKVDLSTDFIVKTINTPGLNFKDEFYKGAKFYENFLVEFEEKFLENYAKFVALYDGIGELINSLKELNFTLAVATNSPVSAALLTLENLNIKDSFKFVVGRDETTPEKPDPAMLLKLLELGDFSKDRAIFIGDSLKDEMAARNAKIPYAQVTWGFGESSQNAINFSSKSKLLNHLKDKFYRI